MLRSKTCPKCDADITESYQDYDPDCGIMSASWFCDECDEAIINDDPGEIDDY